MKYTNQSHTQLSGTVRRYRNDDGVTVKALAATLRIRDIETQGHCERVVKFSSILGMALGLNRAQMKSLKYGSLLHDIGKIGIPERFYISLDD
jgi:putative two-component system response regulator